MRLSPERCDFNTASIIDNDYIVERLLGEGTFGKVFCIKSLSGQIYALKLLKLWTVEPNERTSLIKRFDMEFETGKIQSDYLVHSYKKGMAFGNPYILMEYCPNGDLLYAAENSRLDFSIVGYEILCGLRDLHNCGKVHRDLKPENVLIRQNGSAVLTDFGISGDQNKRTTERGILGKPKQIFGTYGYMPPEQVNPKRGNATVLPTTDIFSFGVMMYQVLTKKMPFGPLTNEKELYDYIQNSKSGIWDRSILKNLSYGKEWTILLEGCLVPDFKNRYQNVDEVLAALPYKEQTFKQRDNKTFKQTGNGLLLRVMQGEEYGKIYKINDLLSGGRIMITLGRYDDNAFNTIAIKEFESCYISRKHCTIEFNSPKNEWIIRDGQWDKSSLNGWKSSLNGTYINSTEVTMDGMPFAIGDIISVGDVKLRVEGY